MNIQVTKPFAAAKLPPREPTLPELIERAWNIERRFAECTDAEWNELNDAAYEAHRALLDHLFALGVTRDLAKKMGELI